MTLLVAMTLAVVFASHVHSARQAWAEMRAKQLPSPWRKVLSYAGRHHLHYSKRMPMLIAFVLVSVVVVVSL